MDSITHIRGFPHVEETDIVLFLASSLFAFDPLDLLQPDQPRTEPSNRQSKCLPLLGLSERYKSWLCSLVDE